MTGINEITDELKRLMITKYPNAQPYINICPAGHTRPAFFIRCIEYGMADINRSTVKMSVDFIITYLTDADIGALSSTAVLSKEQEKILSIFRDGYITVGTRKIKVRASAGNINYNETNVDLQFEYFDDRSDVVDNTPLMSSIITNTKLK